MKKLMLAALLLGALNAHAQVTVSQAWVRTTVAQQKATGAFFQLNATADSRLVEVRSPLAGIAEIHEMAMDGSVMKMRQVPGLDVQAGKAVELKPGGYHVMLMDLKKPVAAGETVPLTLIFEGKDKRRQTIEIKAEARSPGAPADHKH